MYGRSQSFEDAVLEGGSHRKVDFGWFVFPFRTSAGWGLVDTGFEDPAMAEEFQLETLDPAASLLGDLGVEPGEIRDVILTHGHWDHIGAVAAFPRARLWLSRPEWEAMQGALRDKARAAGYRRADLDRLEEARRGGRLRLFSDQARVTPGVVVRVVGGHTPGCLAVCFADRLVLAGDNAYLYRSLEQDIPIAPQARQGGPDALPHLRRFPGKLVPGHDPRILDREPRVTQRVARLL